MIMPQFFTTAVPLIVVASFVLTPFILFRTNPEHETNLDTVSRLAGVALPGGALNVKTSAHFIEINSIYTAEMSRRVVMGKPSSGSKQTKSGPIEQD